MVPTVCRKVCQPTPVMPILLKAGWIFFFNTEAKSRGLAAQHGHQADHVVAQARQHGQYQMPEPEAQAQRAVTWARDHVFERSAVQDRRAILETALVRGMGETTYVQVRHEFERRIEAGEFREVSHVGADQQY